MLLVVGGCCGGLEGVGCREGRGGEGDRLVDVITVVEGAVEGGRCGS
jgi:hypothetical protein